MKKEDMVKEILENAKQMILKGVLVKNVKKHFTNLGMSSELAEKICKIAKLEAEQWQLKKAI